MSTDFEIREGVTIISKSTVYKVLGISNMDDGCAILARCIVEETGNIFTLKCIPTKYLLNYKQEMKVLNYLKDRYPEENNFVKIFEHFSFHNWFCFVFEKFGVRLSDFVKSRADQRLNIKEIKMIAQQMLSALYDLQAVGITHMDINADNIMIVNEESQPFRVKLTGFGGAGKTSALSEVNIPKTCGYCAPEAFLQCQLDEKVAMWSLGITLALVFLGFPMYPTCCEYEYIRTIVNVNGLPHRKYLDQGQRTDEFFTLNSDWSLQTPEEYSQKTGRNICRGNSFYDDFKSIRSLIFEVDPEEYELEEVIAFIDLLEKMLLVNPEDRISPAEALTQRFVREDFPSQTSSSEISQCEDEAFILDEGVTFGPESAYYLEEFIGVGFFGIVAKCKNVATEEDVAVKIFTDQEREFGEDEVQILQAISNLDPDENHIIRFIDSFTDKGFFYIVQELLDVDLFNFLRQRDCKPLTLAEIRPIAQQMFVTLSALRNIGITHSDIKADNIMLVNHDLQPYRVKLIDFGMAYRTADSSETSLVQVHMYRAPEVFFGLSHNESIDMWSLGCTLVSLFLFQALFTPCEYETVRRIIKLCGFPDKSILDRGLRVRLFFTEIHNGSDVSWRFKTKEEYELATGKTVEPWDDTIESLDDLLNCVSEEDNPTEFQDLISFIDLLKKIFVVNPDERILPEDALNHPFITMEHLPGTSSYVTESLKILEARQHTNPDSDTKAATYESDFALTESEDETKTSQFILDRHYHDVAIIHKVTTIENLPCTSLRSGVTEGVKIPARNQLSKFKNHSSVDKDKSVDEMETSILQFKKGVQIKHQSDIYIIEEVIGPGCFGSVVKCSIKGTDKMVAIKIFRQHKHKAAMDEINVYSHLRTLDPNKHNIIEFIKCFIYKDCFCLVFELYHSTLFDLLKKQNWRALTVDEIRPIAQQMLVTLSGLKSTGIVHSDIKPDNIMLVKDDLQPFEVNLIDFGLAFGTSYLPQFRQVQPNGYRAPEVFLGLPYDESIDMWGLGCTLAYMFLAKHLFPSDDYDVMRVIIKCCGMPDKSILDKSRYVQNFFILDGSEPEKYWRLKTEEEYARDSGKLRFSMCPLYNKLQCLDDFLEMKKEDESFEGIEDFKAFIDLLKKMLAVNPADRISPDDALRHPFITMEHLPSNSLGSHVTTADEMASGNQLSISEGDKDKPDVDLTKSEHETETSTLKLEKGVKIVNESDVYIIEEVLGSESDGQFVKCRKEGSDKLVEVKVFRKQNHLTAIKQVNLYANPSDKYLHIVRKYADCFIFKDCFCLVFECLEDTRS